MSKFRKKPVIIEAILPWNGKEANMGMLDDFCGFNWGRADAKDQDSFDAADVVVWNIKERHWFPVPIGHWLIRGVAGELYSCDPEVFAQTYEEENLEIPKFLRKGQD